MKRSNMEILILEWVKESSIDFAKWVSNKKLIKHDVNDIWYDSEFDIEVGNSELLWDLFNKDDDWHETNSNNFQEHIR